MYIYYEMLYQSFIDIITYMWKDEDTCDLCKSLSEIVSCTLKGQHWADQIYNMSSNNQWFQPRLITGRLKSHLRSLSVSHD